MPRRARSIQGGLVYHVLNRSNGRHPIFRKEADYVAFERVLEEAFEREPLRILAYCVLPNHWHFVVWPKQGADRQVSEFFRWLTVTHTQRWHAHYHTSGIRILFDPKNPDDTRIDSCAGMWLPLVMTSTATVLCLAIGLWASLS